MLYQVCLSPEDRLLLWFIWHCSVKTHQMCLPFGTMSSPCCAIFALLQHTRNHQDSYPDTLQSVKQSFYEDNCLESFPTIPAATRWNCGDTFGYQYRPIKHAVLTMRTAYQVIASQYDPLVFIVTQHAPRCSSCSSGPNRGSGMIPIYLQSSNRPGKPGRMSYNTSEEYPFPGATHQSL